MGMQFQEGQDHHKALVVLEEVVDITNKMQAMLQAKCNKHLLLKYIENILIPKANSSAFYDYGESAETYRKIDDQIVSFCLKLFENSGAMVDETKIRNLLILPKVCGGTCGYYLESSST